VRRNVNVLTRNPRKKPLILRTRLIGENEEQLLDVINAMPQFVMQNLQDASARPKCIHYIGTKNVSGLTLPKLIRRVVVRSLLQWVVIKIRKIDTTVLIKIRSITMKETYTVYAASIIIDGTPQMTLIMSLAN
jgi:hypothetical protein